jgi:hypothetical protein
MKISLKNEKVLGFCEMLPVGDYQKDYGKETHRIALKGQ